MSELLAEPDTLRPTLLDGSLTVVEYLIAEGKSMKAKGIVLLLDDGEVHADEAVLNCDDELNWPIGPRASVFLMTAEVGGGAGVNSLTDPAAPMVLAESSATWR